MAEAIENRQELQEFLRKSVLDIAVQVGNQPGLGDLQRKVLEDATAFYDKLVDRHSDQDDVLFEAACGYLRLGRIYRMTIAPEATGPLLTKSIDILSALHEKSPRQPQYRHELAAAHRILGNNLAYNFERDEDGLFHMQRSVDLLADLAQEYPDEFDYVVEENDCRSMLASICVRLGRWADAQQQARMASESAFRLVGRLEGTRLTHDRFGKKLDLVACVNGALSLSFQMDIELACRDDSTTRNLCERLTCLRDRIVADATTNRESLTILIRTDCQLGDYYLAHLDFDSALDAYEDAAAAADEMIDRYPDFNWGKRSSTGAYLRLGKVFVGFEDYDAAMAAYAKAQATLMMDATVDQSDDAKQNQMRIDVGMAYCDWRKGDRESAAQRFRQAIADARSLDSAKLSQHMRHEMATLLVTCPIPSLRDPSTAARILASTYPAAHANDWQLQGIVSLRNGEFDAAIESFQECVSSGSVDACDWLYLTLCYANRGEMDEAARCYSRALQAIEAYEPISLRNLGHPDDLRDLMREAEAAGVAGVVDVKVSSVR
ncbi:MAG: tetratricopeptide repeat protein [Planctomycetales bacterium]|nr:tetratricopeptide repeat protein [Planctomycetales bacterium]